MALSISTAVNRVRIAVGDAGDALLMPGGVAVYKGLLENLGDDEAAAYQAAAGILAGTFASQPVRVSSGGESVDFSARVSTWLAMNSGSVPYPFAVATDAGAATSAITLVPATFRDTSSNDEYSR